MLNALYLTVLQRWFGNIIIIYLFAFFPTFDPICAFPLAPPGSLDLYVKQQQQTLLRLLHWPVDPGWGHVDCVAECLTLLRCCWPSSRRSASWRSSGSRLLPCGHAADGLRPSPSSSGGATTWGPARLRRGGRWGSCGRSPPGSGRPPAEGEGQREEGRRAGLSKAARAEPAEAIGMHEVVEVWGWGVFEGIRGLGRCRGEWRRTEASCKTFHGSEWDHRGSTRWRIRN